MSRIKQLSCKLITGLCLLTAAYSVRAQTIVAAKWIGGAGNWMVAANWDIGQAPVNGNGTNYTVTIPGTGAVTLSQSTIVNNLTLSGALQISSGAALSLSSGGIQLLSGTIQGGTVNATNGAVVATESGGTLDGVTINGLLDVGSSEDDAYLAVTNGLQLNGTALVGNPTNYYYGEVEFEGGQTLGGNGTVIFGADSENYLIQPADGGSITLGPGITVRGERGQIGYSYWYGSAPGTLVNQGTISADVEYGTITIYSQNFTNEGLAQAINGGTLALDGMWNNTGTLAESGGAIRLGGSFALTNLGTFHATNGMVLLAGTLTNTGATLALEAPSGPWVLNGGRILGGTIQASNGISFEIESGTFDGVTVDGVLDVGNAYDGANLAVTNGLALNGTAFVGASTNYYYGTIAFEGSQTLSGNGTIQFGGYYYNYYYYGPNILYFAYPDSTLTLGPGITVRGQAGMLGYGSGYGGWQNSTIINQGTISADVTNGNISINAAAFSNQGLAQAVNGGAISLDGSWINNGTLSESGGTLNLGGAFAFASIGTLLHTNGAIYITGVLTNTGATFYVGGAYGQWGLNGGTILGGTVATASGASLIINGSGTLDGVQVNGSVDVGATHSEAELLVTNGLALYGAIFLGASSNSYSYGGLNFEGTQTFGGSGTVIFGWSGENSIGASSPGVTLTIGPGISILGQGGGVIGYYWSGEQNATIINHGTILCSNGTITINPQSFLNDGTVEAINGGSIWLSGAWSNGGVLAETNGSIRFDGNFGSAQLGNLQLVDGTVYIGGTVTNTGTTLSIGAGTTEWVLDGGVILGGTIAAASGQPLIVDYGTLNGVTLNGVLDVGNTLSGAYLYVTNGLELDGTALVGNPTNYSYGTIDFTGSQTLGGSGTVIFGDYSYYYYYYENRLYLGDAGTTLTLGAGITVRGASGEFYGNDYGDAGNGALINLGTISSDQPGGKILISGLSFTNLGLTQASNGGSLDFAGIEDFSQGTLRVEIDGPENFGAISFTGGISLATVPLTVELDPGYVPALGSSFSVLTYDAASGILGSLSLPKQDFAWQANYGLTVFTLTATNEVAPVVSIVSPSNNMVFTSPANIGITAAATNFYLAISKVDFFAQGRLLGEASTPPYAVTWSNAPPGIYQLTAEATDANGNVAVSLPALVTVLPAVPGVNYVWTGGQSSDWFTSGNWTPNGIPGINDSATINGATNDTYYGETLTVSRNTSIGFLNFISGTINGTGAVAVSNSFDWIAGSLYCPIFIQSNAVMNIGGAGTLYLYGALTNAGTVNWVGPADLILYNYQYDSWYGVIENLPGAVFNALNNQTLGCWCGGGEYFDNAGTFTKRVGKSTTTINLPFTNSGTLDVESGAVAVRSQSTLSNGVLNLALNGPNDCGKLELSGGLDLAAAGTVKASLSSGYTPSRGDGFELLSYSYATGSLSNLVLPSQDQWEVIPNPSALIIVAGSPQQPGGSYTWTGSAGADWYNAANWSPASVPSGSEGEIITITNGTIDLTSPVTINGQLNWYGGELTGSALTIGQRGTMSIDGDSLKYLQNSLTNAGTIIWADGNIVVSNCAAGAAGVVNLPGALWDIWCDAAMSSYCSTANACWKNSGTLSKSDGTGTTYIGIPFENDGGSILSTQGAVEWDAAVVMNGAAVAGPGALTFNGGFQNNDSLGMEDTTVNLTGAWTNAGAFNATNSVMNLGGSFTTGNLGLLNTSGGTVNIAGSLVNTGATLTIGSICQWILDGGDIIGGTITATNDGVLLVNGSGGVLDGVTINGTLDVGNSYYYAAVTVTNGLVANGDIVLGNPTNGEYGVIYFAGTEALGGHGTVILGDSEYNGLQPNLDNTTLTIANGMTVRGNSGYIGASYYYYSGVGREIVNQGIISCDVYGGEFRITGQPVLNEGVIRAINGGSLYIDALQNDPGATVLANGGKLTLNGSYGAWTNAGTIAETNAQVMFGGSLTTASNTLASLGTYYHSGGTVNLTGVLNNSNSTLVLNAATGPWVLDGGTILGGTILTTNNASFIVESGVLNGVTVDGLLDIGNSYGGANLWVTNGLELNGTALLGNPTNYYYGGIGFEGSQELGGNGTVILGTDDNDYYEYVYANSLYLSDSGTTLTIGPGIKVRGKNGSIGYSYWFGGGQNITVINQGAISCDVTNGTIGINAQPFVNDGSLAMSNGGSLVIDYMTNITGLSQSGGGSLTLDGNWQNNQALYVSDGGTLSLSGNWTNAGSINATNATVNLGGTFTLANLGTLNHSGTSVNLSGVLLNSNTTFNLAAATGPLGLMDGTIIGGTVIADNGNPLIVDRGVLNGVTVEGVLDVGNSVDGANLLVTNGLVLDGEALVGNPTNYSYGGIGFEGTQTLGGNGQVVFGRYYYDYYYDYGYNALYFSDSGTLLTLGPGISVHGRSGNIGYGSYWGGYEDGGVINQGTISADVSNGVITVEAQSVTNLGSLEVGFGATLSWDSDLNFNGPQRLSSQPGGTFAVQGSVLGSPSGSSHYNPQGTLSFPSGTHQLEAMSADMGNTANGYVDNYAYGGISLASGAEVTLVNLSTNTASSIPECIYVNSLSIASGATLNLNGIHLYARLAAVAGTVANGTVVQAPNGGGPIVPANIVSATLANAGALADWTFFGRAGQVVAVAVDTGSQNVLAPQLEYAFIQLFDPATNLLAQVSNNVAGQTALINGLVLPADGTYTVTVRAPASAASSTGNYQISVWTMTPSVGSLIINQQVNGNIPTPYSVDLWNFSGSAGQQIRFDLLNSSAPGCAFSLTGPGGWIGFSNLITSSSLVTLPASGNYQLTAFGTGGQYDINFAFELVQTAETNIALRTAFTDQFVGSGQAQLVEVTITNSDPLRISLALGSIGSHVQLYAKLGSPPTPSDYDYSYQGVSSSTEDIIIPSPTPGSWYILIYALYVPEPTSYTLEVIQSSLILESFAPSLAGSGVNTVISIDGAGFDSNDIVQLVSTNGTHVAAQSINLISPTLMSAFFGSNTIPPGNYTVCVTAGADQECLSNIVTVIPGGLPDFHASMIVPSIVGYHQPATIYVDYANTGTAAMPAPLILVTATQSGKPGPILTLEASQQSAIAGIESKLLSNFEAGITNSPPGFTTEAEILASGNVPGLLQPGESNRVSIYYAGWLEPWDFNRPPLEFTITTFTADDTNLNDWASYALTSLPGGGTSSQWQSILSGLEGEFGGTWGNYVTALDQLVNSASPVDGSAYDASRIFETAFEQISGFGSASISGKVIGTANSEPITNTTVVASQQPASAQSVVRSSQTDSYGSFQFTNLPPGTYQLSVQNYITTNSYVYTITDQSALSGLLLEVTPYVAPTPAAALTHTNESTPSLATDASGIPHMVWNRGGEIWHAYFDGTNWQASGAVPGAAGTAPRIVAASNLVDGSAGGLMIAWQTVGSNSSALYYVVATNSASGSYSWQTSSPALLSNGETNFTDLDNQNLALLVMPNGKIVAVWQKIQTAMQDDADLYFGTISIDSANLTWPANTPLFKAAPDDVTDCVSFGVDLGHVTIPKSIPVLGGTYGLSFSDQVCGSFNTCNPSVAISGSLEMEVTELFKINGDLEGTGDYGTDPTQCVYIPKDGKLAGTLGASVDVPVWFFPLGPVLIQAGSTWGISGKIEGTWTGGNFPSWPADETEGSVTARAGIYGLILIPVGLFGTADLRLQAVGSFEFKYQNAMLELGEVSVEASATGSYKGITIAYQHTWSTSDSDVIGASHPLRYPSKIDLEDPDLTLSVASLLGTTNVYGGSPVMTGVNTNVVPDGKPAMAVTPAGQAMLAWTEDSDDAQSWLGSRVLVASMLNGAWTDPLEVTNSRGFNSDVKLSIDSQGNPLLVWTMASSAGLSATNSVDEVTAAMASNSVVYSSYVGGAWSAPATVAIQSGSVDNVSLGKTAGGQTLAAWIDAYEDTNGVDTNTICAAVWNGTNWAAPITIATGQFTGGIEVSVLASSTTLFWTQQTIETNSASSDASVVFDLSLYSSSANAVSGKWSAPQRFSAGDTYAAAQADNLAKTLNYKTPTPRGLLGIGSPPMMCCMTNPPTNPPPPMTNCLVCTTNPAIPVNSEDPNAKIGPAGYGAPGWITGSTPFPYTINFENATNATAPAQIVQISDYLDTNFNWSTFELSEISFGGTFISIPPNSQYFATNVSVTYENVPLTVQVQAGIDLATGQVTAKFVTIDASTDLSPPVNIGFLPPEDGTGRGEGYVSYFIQPKTGLAEGTQITNIAYIQFDENPVIATDQVNDDDASLGIDTNKMDLVTIDNIAPVSSVNALPSEEGTSFTVSWSGADVGSGVAGYSIYASTNGGSWGIWLANITNTNATFTGNYNTEYAFYSVAEDYVGNVEAAPTNAQAQTTVGITGSPIISQQPAGEYVIAGSTAKFKVVAQGAPALKYQWMKGSDALKNGGKISGATTATLVITSVAANEEGSYSVVVVNNSGSVTSADAVLQIVPGVAITSPGANAQFSTPSITVKGTATDALGARLSQILWQINGGEFQPASGLKSWTATVALRAGTNVFGVKSVDSNGVDSALASRDFFFKVYEPITLGTTGYGSISGIHNNEMLLVGKGATATAVPGAGNLFSNWSGSVNSSANPLTFIMQTNMVLTANFVTNVFLAAEGTYNGLFAPANALRRQTNSGAITFTVTSQGAVSGKLTIGTNTPSFSGKFNLEGAATTTTARKGSSTLTTALQLDFAGKTATGSVSDGSFDAAVTADLEQKSANYQGHYTLIIPGADDPANGPFGPSSGVVTIESGKVSFVGYLADGSKTVSQSAFVSKDGFWPLYLSLYNGNGSIWSWNSFTNLSDTTMMLSSNASWINETNTAKTNLYRGGFTNDAVSLIGSPYNSADKPLLAFTNGEIIIEGGNLPFAITNQFKWVSPNLITATNASDTNKLSIAINNSTGVITGHFADPSNPKKTININGVLLQNGTNAQGFFLGTNQSGTFILTPQ